MAQPVAPEREFSFTGWTSAHPDQPQPGDKLDAEIDRCNNSIAEVIARLDLIQRDDGALENDSVGTDQMQVAVLDKGAALPLAGDGKSWNAGGLLVRGGPPASTHYLESDALTSVRWVQVELINYQVRVTFDRLTTRLKSKGTLTQADMDYIYALQPPPNPGT